MHHKDRSIWELLPIILIQYPVYKTIVEKLIEEVSSNLNTINSNKEVDLNEVNQNKNNKTHICLFE